MDNHSYECRHRRDSHGTLESRVSEHHQSCECRQWGAAHGHRGHPHSIQTVSATKENQGIHVEQIKDTSLLWFPRDTWDNPRDTWDNPRDTWDNPAIHKTILGTQVGASRRVTPSFPAFPRKTHESPLNLHNLLYPPPYLPLSQVNPSKSKNKMKFHNFIWHKRLQKLSMYTYVCVCSN